MNTESGGLPDAAVAGASAGRCAESATRMVAQRQIVANSTRFFMRGIITEPRKRNLLHFSVSRKCSRFLFRWAVPFSVKMASDAAHLPAHPCPHSRRLRIVGPAETRAAADGGRIAPGIGFADAVAASAVARHVRARIFPRA